MLKCITKEISTRSWPWHTRGLYRFSPFPFSTGSFSLHFHYSRRAAGYAIRSDALCFFSLLFPSSRINAFLNWLYYTLITQPIVLLLVYSTNHSQQQLGARAVRQQQMLEIGISVICCDKFFKNLSEKVYNKYVIGRYCYCIIR